MYVVLLFAGGAACVLIAGRRKDGSRSSGAPRPATEGFAEARPGKAPYPLASIVDLPGGSIGKAVDALNPGVQRLAIVTADSEPVPTHALIRRIGAHAPPLSETLHWRTKDRGAFVVDPIDALHDAYFAHAHKQPRL